MRADDLTIITCSYNTPTVTECMLKSYVKYHEGRHRIIIVENSSPGDKTRDILKKNNVPYVDGHDVLPPAPEEHGWGWSHHKGVDWAIRRCPTRYCLLVDTDIIFQQNLQKMYDHFISDEDAVALGPHTERRRPFKYDENFVCVNPEQKYILPRIHPCFTLLDANFFKEHEDITYNGSPETGPIEMIDKLGHEDSYDVGSYVLLRIRELGKTTINIRHDKYFQHGEGLSWAGKTDMLEYYEKVIYNRLSDIDITDRFYTDIDYDRYNIIIK